jgi:threonine/homoserine/homoserine lactone efflux protein
MNLHLFMKGILIGVLIAVPVGPIGFLCIKRTLNAGRIYGFVAGLGVATADTIYGAISGFGLKAVSSMLIHYQYWFRLFGGLFFVAWELLVIFPSQQPHRHPLEEKVYWEYIFRPFF